MHRIVVDFGGDVQVYAERGKGNPCSRPAQCPSCGQENRLVGHGYYRRKPKGLREGYVIWIKRWRCRACQHTISCLPNFVLSFRHYLLAIIERVVVARFEQQASWEEVQAHIAEQGTPALRTLQRWCCTFAGQAAVWLAAAQNVLAQQDSASPWLDPQGEATQARSGAQALLSVSLHLLAWAKTQWQELAGYGLNNRLKFLWLWGSEHGLGRLI
jgi:hypothetical protein